MGGKNNRFAQSEASRRRQEEAFYLERAERLTKRAKQREAAIDTGELFTMPAEPKSDA